MVLVLIDVVAGEVEAGEKPFAARVGEELGVGQGGDRRLRIAAERAGGGLMSPPSLTFSLNISCALLWLVPTRTRSVDWPPAWRRKLTTIDLNEGPVSSPMVIAAGGESLAILAAYDEGALLAAGDDGSRWLGGNPEWDAFVRCGHQLADDGGCGVDAVDEFLSVSAAYAAVVTVAARQDSGQKVLQKLAHEFLRKSYDIGNATPDGANAQ